MFTPISEFCPIRSARVVVDGVLGEVRRDQIGVAGVERVVVGADLVEIAHGSLVISVSKKSIWDRGLRR
jgi:hypothetical protein